MLRVNRLVIVMLFVLAGGLAFNTASEAKDKAHQDEIKTMGRFYLRTSDDADGNVKAVIAQGDCSGYAPHVHVFREAGTANVFSIQATPEKLKELEQSPNKKGITLAGKIAGSTRGCILTVQ